jgi:hypothetical protein
VTGVDFVPKALRRAGARAKDAEVEVRLLEGDVTNLPAEVGSGYKLLLDFGCFHDELSEDQRKAEGRQATAAAGPDATLWLPRGSRAAAARYRGVPAARRSRPLSRSGSSPMRCHCGYPKALRDT